MSKSDNEKPPREEGECGMKWLILASAKKSRTRGHVHPQQELVNEASISFYHFTQDCRRPVRS